MNHTWTTISVWRVWFIDHKIYTAGGSTARFKENALIVKDSQQGVLIATLLNMNELKRKLLQWFFYYY